MDLHTPTLVPNLPSDLVDVHVWGGQVCVTSTSKGLYCWGFNEVGELGHTPGQGSPADLPCPNNNAYECNSTPQLVANTVGAVSTATSQATTCARRNDGTVACLGDNGAGQFGDGITSAATTTITASNVTAVTQISSRAGNVPHFCAVTTQNAVKCWGITDLGEIGNGVDSTNATDAGLSSCSGIGHCFSTAQSVTGLIATKVAAGSAFSLALGTNGKVYGCRNDQGQTGHPPATQGDHSCAEVLNGNALCNPSPTLVQGLP